MSDAVTQLRSARAFRIIALAAASKYLTSDSSKLLMPLSCVAASLLCTMELLEVVIMDAPPSQGCKATTSRRAPLRDAVAATKAGSSVLTADEAAGSKSATETAKYLSRASLDCETTAQSPKFACKQGDRRATDLIPYDGWLEEVPWEGLGSFMSTLILLVVRPKGMRLAFTMLPLMANASVQCLPSDKASTENDNAGNSQSIFMRSTRRASPKSMVRDTGPTSPRLLAQNVASSASTAAKAPCDVESAEDVASAAACTATFSVPAPSPD